MDTTEQASSRQSTGAGPTLAQPRATIVETRPTTTMGPTPTILGARQTMAERQSKSGPRATIAAAFLPTEGFLETIVRHIPYKPVFEKVNLIKDDLLNTAYTVYKPTRPTLSLQSERQRDIYCEDISEHVDPKKVPTLKTLAMRIVTDRFRSGDVPQALSANEQINFCEMLNINAPILNILKISNELFWRRMVETKLKDKAFIEERKKDWRTIWKNLGVQVKYEEILEKSYCEGWDHENMLKLTQKLSPYIYELRINQLYPKSEYTFERDSNLSKEKVFEYPPAECHHINLSILGMLRNLHTLIIEFNPPELVMNYKDWFFLFSYVDVENLAAGLTTITTLRTFKIRRSLMDTTKLLIILNAMQSLRCENFEFFFCNLQDDCGIVLSNFFNKNPYIRSLELRGNYIQDNGLRALSYGIQEYEGKLSHLGLSLNPIKDAGLTFLARALYNCLQVESLDLAGIEISPLGSALIAAIIKNHKILTHVNLVACPLKGQAGDRILKAMCNNRRIVFLDVRCCDLSLTQQFKLKILVNRNIYMKNNPYLYADGEVIEITGKTERKRQKNESANTPDAAHDLEIEESESVDIPIDKDPDIISVDFGNEIDITTTKNDDEIRDWVARIKHPVLLKSIREFKRQQKCKQMLSEKKLESKKSSHTSMTDRYRVTEGKCIILESDTDSIELGEKKSDIFVYNSNEFNEEQFLDLVRIAGDKQKPFYKEKLAGKKL